MDRKESPDDDRYGTESSEEKRSHLKALTGNEMEDTKKYLEGMRIMHQDSLRKATMQFNGQWSGIERVADRCLSQCGFGLLDSGVRLADESSTVKGIYDFFKMDAIYGMMGQVRKLIHEIPFIMDGDKAKTRFFHCILRCLCRLDGQFSTLRCLWQKILQNPHRDSLMADGLYFSSIVLESMRETIAEMKRMVSKFRRFPWFPTVLNPLDRSAGGNDEVVPSEAEEHDPDAVTEFVPMDSEVGANSVNLWKAIALLSDKVEMTHSVLEKYAERVVHE